MKIFYWTGIISVSGHKEDEMLKPKLSKKELKKLKKQVIIGRKLNWLYFCVDIFNLDIVFYCLYL